MGVKFCVVNRTDAINERMKSILEDYGLSERLVSEYHDALLNELNLSKLDTCCTRIVNASKDWINLQLEI